MKNTIKAENHSAIVPKMKMAVPDFVFFVGTGNVSLIQLEEQMKRLSTPFEVSPLP